MPIITESVKGFLNLFPPKLQPMKYIFPFVLLALISCNRSSDTASSNSKLEHMVDSLVKKDIDSVRAAGIAIGVFKGKEKLLLKSYGYADLEHDVKLPIDASFEIGSVTKQFTAVAALLLVEQGKLSLDDDITKYVKFDTKGRKNCETTPQSYIRDQGLHRDGGIRKTR
jgi:CubicO group peptidase (beta-lactamase class C family)